MTKAALIIVDLLNDFFERSSVLAAKRDSLVTATNELTRGFRRANLPIFWVRQEFAPDLNDASLEVRQHKINVTIAGTPGCQMLPELERGIGETEIIKKRYSAFFRTNLQERLSALDCDFLVVTGINTHACVRMTVIDAYQLDHQVIVADECTASRDTEHHAVTKRYLDGKIASFRSNREILSTILSNNSLQPIAPTDSAPAE